MMRNTVLLAALAGLSGCLACDLGGSSGQPENASSVKPVECPRNVPARLPKQFPILVDIVNTIYTQMCAGEIAAIQQTFLEHGLVQRGGEVMEVRLGFSSLGGITNMVVEISPYSAEPKRMIGVKRRPKTGEIVEFSQLNVLWEGSSDIDVKEGAIVGYREGYIDFDDQSGKPTDFGRIGLQVKWSPDGEIVSEEYLEERRPFRLRKSAGSP